MVADHSNFPPDIDYKLSGWDLLWARLSITGDVDELDEERSAVAQRIKRIMKGLQPSEHPTTQSVRSLFRNAGCDPTRYRPSSEALIKRISKGDPLPAISPAVDINNLWSVEMLVPCCVIDPKKVSGTITMRKGQTGEIMDSMRGPFNLEGKPTLLDDEGPFGTPITDAERVKVTKDKGTYWLVAYLPKIAVKRADAVSKLQEITGRLSNVEVEIAA